MKNSKIASRPPTIKIQNQVGLLNQSAVTLLSEGGERYVCVCRSSEGELYLKPLEVPKETVAVRLLFIPAKGSSRIATGDIPPGDYNLIWRGGIEAAVLERVVAATTAIAETGAELPAA